MQATITLRLPVEAITEGDLLADRWDCSDGPMVTVAGVRHEADGLGLRFAEDPIPGHWHHLRSIAGLVDIVRSRPLIAAHYEREARAAQAERENRSLLADLAEMPCACPDCGGRCLPCRARHILEVSQ